jgi:hypothetical protein
LFDIEYSLDVDDPIIEWEITAHKTEEGTAVVGQVVLKKEYKENWQDAVRIILEKYDVLDAVKIYDKFENSDVTGKRDFQKLKSDKTGYCCVDEKNNIKPVIVPKSPTAMK